MVELALITGVKNGGTMKELLRLEFWEQSRPKVLLKARTTLIKAGYLRSNSSEWEEVAAFWFWINEKNILTALSNWYANWSLIEVFVKLLAASLNSSCKDYLFG